jgi:hypothetical protein
VAIVIVESQTLRTLAGNATAVSVLPELVQIRDYRGCNCSKEATLAPIYATLKTRVASLNGAPLDKIKTVLHASQLRIIYRDARGHMQDVTI